MEQRTLLAVALSIAVLVIFQIFFAPQPEQIQTNGTEANVTAPEARIEAAKKPKEEAAQTHGQAENTAAPTHPAREIEVETPLFRAIFSEKGGTIKSFVLKRYRSSIEKDAPNVDLLNVKDGEPLPLAVSIPSAGLFLETAVFSADRKRIRLDSPDAGGELTFTYRLPDSRTVIKRFRFKGGSYWIDMEIEFSGPGTPVIPALHLYNHPLGGTSRYIFAGASYYTGEELEEVKLDEGETKAYEGPLEWIGYGDNYFTTTIIPLSPQAPFKATISQHRAEALTEIEMAPKEAAQTYRYGLYFGPKEIDILNGLGHHLSKSINFGWFDIIAKPILYALKFLYGFIHNYGWAIIVITVLIKLAFWPLAHKSATSMKTMQKLQPKLQKLKEKYGDDKERLNRELMQLYKTYKVNPMSGCLPMLLQIPVFFALYKVLLQAIELRHAPFMLWINDLSAPDRLMIPGVDLPFLHGVPVLTLLMGASMYLQQKMSPSSLDPTQAKMMQMLPIVFTFMFINFPSGLVLYWLVNNLLSIVQQYYVNKFTD